MRIVLDTNVLVSALISAGKTPAQLLARCQAGELELLVSPDSLAELRRMLAYPRIRKRLHYSDEQIDQFVAFIEQISTVVIPASVARVVPGDADDDMLNALALAGEAPYLVTGEDHLLSIGRHQSVTILKPAAFLLLWQTLQKG